MTDYCYSPKRVLKRIIPLPDTTQRNNMKLLLMRQNQGPGNSGSPGTDDHDSTATLTTTLLASPAAVQSSTSLPATATIVETTTLAPPSTTPPLTSSALPNSPTSGPTSNTSPLLVSVTSITSTSPTLVGLATPTSAITGTQPATSGSRLVTPSTSPTPSTTTFTGPAAADTETPVNAGIIIGGVVGAFCLAAVIFTFWRYYSRRHISDSDLFDTPPAAGRRHGSNLYDERPWFYNLNIPGMRTVELPAGEVRQIVGGRQGQSGKTELSAMPGGPTTQSRHVQARFDAGEMWAGGIGHELAGTGPPRGPPMELPAAAAAAGAAGRHEPAGHQQRRVDGNATKNVLVRSVSSPAAGRTSDSAWLSFTTPSPITVADKSPPPAVGGESNEVSPTTPQAHTKNSVGKWGKP